MNLGELSKNRCIICGKGVQAINGLLMHIEFDDTHAPKLDPRLKVTRRLVGDPRRTRPL